VHAEVRVNEEGIWILEIAARSIGGLCARVLTHSLGTSLEELILRQALGEPLGEVRDSIASGVMMIPIPRRGIYHGVDGLDAALAVPGITGITITAQKGRSSRRPRRARATSASCSRALTIRSRRKARCATRCAACISRSAPSIRRCGPSAAERL
jgi:hypothetical protein